MRPQEKYHEEEEEYGEQQQYYMNLHHLPDFARAANMLYASTKLVNYRIDATYNDVQMMVHAQQVQGHEVSVFF